MSSTYPEGLPQTGAELYPGEPPHDLGRSLKSRHVAMIAIGGIIGAGLFVGSSASIATVGPAVVVSYALAGLVVLLVMRMLSEMAVAIPGTQSFPDFARAGLGRWAGFLSGWLYWYFWVVVVAIEAIAGAVIIQGWTGLPVWLIGVALMAVLTAVNLMSTRSYGEFEFWFSSIKVAAILVFILLTGSYVLGLGSGAGSGGFANLTAHGGFMPFGFRAVLAGITSVIFALTGAEIATIAAAESAEPGRTVARMTSTVALRILIFYVLSILLIVTIVPWNTIQPGVSPFATALTRLDIPGAATAMTAVVLVAVLSCLNSGLYVTSRVLFALAARGEAPRGLVAVNRRQVPARAILVASLFSYAALAASVLSPTLVFSFLVNASGALMLIIYLMLALAQIRLRRQIEREAPERLQIRMWLFPWASYATVAAMIAVLVAMALTPDLASQFYSSLVITILFGGAFLIMRSRQAKGGSK
ncbi:amino acid permease [Sphingomonas quercus]|uniref:Amino acid permease n=1 Tax=Sphingomonas quercus TaxID=2842451 RepID=A0ABS6BLZ7_9SPHN|nr:amino acid permease [Sphingomonas quercus]MBU3079323.1 amino acid permease [Sphingomonas quercus]